MAACAAIPLATIPHLPDNPAHAVQDRAWGAEMAEQIALRTFSIIDSLQPQTASFIATVARGFLPVEEQAALLVEVAPGMSINRVTDTILKSTSVIPGMQIVERDFGMLEVHHDDRGQIRAAADALLAFYEIDEGARLKPRITSAERLTGVTGYHTQLINRMRHGDMIRQGETLYTLEVHPAGYALIAANEAEKHADIRILEIVTFGAFGRLWISGDEENIAQADERIRQVLGAIDGQANPG